MPTRPEWAASVALCNGQLYLALTEARWLNGSDFGIGPKVFLRGVPAPFGRQRRYAAPLDGHLDSMRVKYQALVLAVSVWVS